MTKPLDIRSFPLHGSQLIEASAGTGKTFTIALLYIRLVLHHGSGLSRPLLPEEILVVTFTEAATQELRERVRARLAEAAQCFLVPDGVHDPVLTELRSDYPTAEWIHCGRLLSLAAQNMDQAAISTIHGWCYRMLREHAFDSGSLFRQTLVTDQRETLTELVRDYWRQEYYSLDEAMAELVSSKFAAPDDLLRAVQPLLHPVDMLITLAGREVAAPARLGAALQPFVDRSQRLAELEAQARKAWLASYIELNVLLDQLRPSLNKNQYAEAKTDETFATLKQDLHDWARGGPPPRRLARFAAGGWALTGKPRPEQPHHPALTALAAFVEEEQQQQVGEDDARAALLLHCARWMEQALIERQQRHAELGFDDLLRRLDAALSGSQGQTLATRIREQFPGALIDEFQDTDPLQYRIFDHVYQVEQNRSDCALILIGDPKQAIYSFRNADIHTYLLARRATAGRHHHLLRNFRSTTDLVGAVNTLFDNAEQAPRGAFRFRRVDDNPLPFLPVRANGRSDQLIVDGAPQTAMTLWHLQPELDEQTCIGLTRYRDEMATACAQTIARLLATPANDSTSAAATGFSDGDTWRPLRPGDIAVLVRSRSEADIIRRQLTEYGLASVFLSDRESVFASQEAVDLLLCLHACAEPMNERKVRAALASHSLERTLGELKQLYQQEELWEDTCELFRGLQHCWQKRGVLPMLRQMLHALDVPARLLAEPEGDRRLTNLLHLAEYLQRASLEHDGELALIRHLAEQIENPGDEEILRLENDADLIRVVTIHKSKGLEYPLVFVPFAAAWKPVDGKKAHVQIMDPERGRRLEFGNSRSNADVWQQADDERLCEDLRLLYVAATRATHAIWLSVAPLAYGNAKKPQLDRSALGYLLGHGNVMDAQTLSDALTTLKQQCAAIAVVALKNPAQTGTAGVPRASLTEQPTRFRPARRATQRVDNSWWIASYSALQTTAMDASALQPAAAREQQTIEEVVSGSTASANEELTAPERQHFSRANIGLHGFHRGPGPGTFLHSLLEWVAQQGFKQSAASPADQLAVIEQRCRSRGWDTDVERLQTWLKGFLGHTFKDSDGMPFSLAELDRYRVEMEFLFPSGRVSTHDIDRLCHQYLMPGQARPALYDNQLNGMVKGFVDLVAEHHNRFYVVDWKSNYLGPDDSHYTDESLTAEILHHRYDVQYSLYLLALHRLLRSRLHNYSYEQHIGGAWYFFLRGWQSPSGGLLSALPPYTFIDELDRLFDHA